MNKAIKIMREWIQWSAINGDRVVWFTNDVLHFNKQITVKDLELLAMEIDKAYNNG
jgi:hypothetical protein